MRSIVAAMVWALPLALSQAGDGFQNHGVASRAVERRGVATVHDRTGHNLVISLNNDHGDRGWVLVTDVDSGVTEQIAFPADVDHSFSLAAPFATYVSKQGRFYTCIGPVLMEFEPSTPAARTEKVESGGSPVSVRASRLKQSWKPFLCSLTANRSGCGRGVTRSAS